MTRLFTIQAEIIKLAGADTCESCNFTRSNCLIYMKIGEKLGKLSKKKSGKIGTFT